MKLDRLHISVFLAIAVLAWAVVLRTQGAHVSWEHLKPFGTVVGVLGTLGLSLEKFLWRQAWLHGWFVKRPDLRGTWRVELQSDWVDPETDERVPLVVCYLGVAQSLSHLQMHLMTKESESWFIAERISPSPSGIGYQLVGVYRNRPQTHLRGDRSEMHFGGLFLDTHGPSNRPESLTGEYWTDRKTKGQMTLGTRVPKLLTRFEDAERAFSEA